MTDIVNTHITNIPGLSFECNCGKKHSIDIKSIFIQKNAISKIGDIVRQFPEGKIFLLADANTYKVCGQKVEEILSSESANFKKFVFQTTRLIIPDEASLGRIFIEIDRDTSLIAAVGSGVINDMSRFLSYKLKIPYVIIATAPSMDGYCSTVSPLIVDKFKITYDAVYPYAAIADIDIIKNAPLEMLQAGFGDILGKLTALADWQLSNKLNNEYLCKTAFEMVLKATNKAIANAQGILKRDEHSIVSIMECLMLSGIAMGLAGNSRPASGAEHHLAHYWEIDAIARGKEHALHGNAVAVGAVVISSLYELMKDNLPSEINVPSAEEIIRLLKAAGSKYTPKDLGISRELFKESLLNAMKIRPRFTIFHLAYKIGLLEKYCELLVSRFY